MQSRVVEGESVRQDQGTAKAALLCSGCLSGPLERQLFGPTVKSPVSIAPGSHGRLINACGAPSLARAKCLCLKRGRLQRQMAQQISHGVKAGLLGYLHSALA